MFGPNTYFEDQVNICYSHRDKIFFDLFRKVSDLFVEKFKLFDYDILFIPGSGTIGLESLMFSIDYELSFIGNEGTFKERLKSLYSNYSKTTGEGVNETSKQKCSYDWKQASVKPSLNFLY